jgi:hypothetical protein
MHTFVLAAAMDSFLKHQAGAHVQLWDMVVAEVFRPLGIFAAPMLHTQEAEKRYTHACPATRRAVEWRRQKERPSQVCH